VALVVDDEGLIRWTLRQRLSAAGFSVLEAENGLDAVDAFLAQRVSIVVVDLALPDLDGLGVLSRIKEVDPTCPVILMTAFGSPEARATAVRLGAAGFVSKPFDLDEMALLVARSARP